MLVSRQHREHYFRTGIGKKTKVTWIPTAVMIIIIALGIVFLGDKISGMGFKQQVGICQDWSKSEVRNALADRSDVDVFYKDCSKPVKATKRSKKPKLLV